MKGSKLTNQSQVGVMSPTTHILYSLLFVLILTNRFKGLFLSQITQINSTNFTVSSFINHNIYFSTSHWAASRKPTVEDTKLITLLILSLSSYFNIHPTCNLRRWMCCNSVQPFCCAMTLHISLHTLLTNQSVLG